MNLTELEIRKKYRYSNLSYVFDVYMECEYRANLTQDEYEGLAPGEFRFDYKSWERRLGISKKQLVRAIKELADDSAVITQTFKGKKGVSSKYFLTRFEEQKKEQNEELKRKCKGTQISLENTGIEVCGGTEKGNEKEQNEEQKKVHSSQHNNLNIISNNIYSANDYEEVWKSYPNKRGKAKAIISIGKILKSISKDELLRCIERYKGDVDKQRADGFKTLAYKNGSTFFNGGYVEYLDKNFDELIESKEEKAIDMDFDDEKYII